MAYTVLTKAGENFINEVCGVGKSSGNNTNLIKGKKTKSDVPSLNVEWTASIIFNGALITKNSELANALIYWFNKYSQEFELNANIIAAQAYAESNYVMWTYSSAASGVNQFTMATIYSVIVNNLGQPISLNADANDIAKITIDLVNPLVQNSYNLKSKTPEDANYNRPILHQNVIDNPDVMIREQCKYMQYLADKCNSLASTSLYCYSRGPAWVSDTYSKAITKTRESKKYGGDYYIEGVNYVLRIFGVLGDKYNNLTLPDLKGNKTRFYKPRGFYFGFNDLLEQPIAYPNPNFNPFDANIEESDEFNLDTPIIKDDIVIKELSSNPKYELIYFPESEYKKEKSEKTQIVLHHTVSGDNVKGDIQWWESQGEKVATSFIIGRKGEIIQLFSTDYWAHHLGIQEKVFSDNNINGVTNKMLNEKSIGIEIDSWGGLIQVNGLWYPAMTDGDTQKLVANTKVSPVQNVVVYSQGFHGFFGFEKYTDDQINGVKSVILAITKKWKTIPLNYNGPEEPLDYSNDNMWGRFDTLTSTWKPDVNALKGKSGIWTHVSYRADKSDCHPQPELISMLQSLK